jgi:hypothetical protein
VDIPAIIESGGRKVHSRVIDVSEGGAKITCVPSPELNSVGSIAIEGMARPVSFVVRGGSNETASLEVTAEGAAREQYLGWLSRQVGIRTAA